MNNLDIDAFADRLDIRLSPWQRDVIRAQFADAQTVEEVGGTGVTPTSTSTTGPRLVVL